MNVYCPNCKNPCSQRARMCPKCGHPLSDVAPATMKPIAAAEQRATPVQPEHNMQEVRPSWRMGYAPAAMGAIVVCAVAAGVFISSKRFAVVPFLTPIEVVVGGALAWGGLVALYTWINVTCNVLIVTNKRCILQKGILSRSTSEVRHVDVRNVQVKQGIIERLVKVGTLKVSSAAQSDFEIVIQGIPDPYYTRDVIDRSRQDRTVPASNE